MFILCQETAAEAGFWPGEPQLSHGEAGEIELAAERAAEQLGLESVYREAVAFGTGPIASGLAKINEKTGLLRNGRSACICGRTGISESSFEGSVIAVVWAVQSCSSIRGASRSTNKRTRSLVPLELAPRLNPASAQ